MAKKRKQRSSQSQPTKTTPDPQPVQQKSEYIPDEDPVEEEVEEEVEEVEVEEEVEEEEDDEEEEEYEDDGEEAEPHTIIGSSVQNGAPKQEDEFDDEPVEKLLEPFGKDQLITLIKKAVEKHPEFISSVRIFVDVGPALGQALTAFLAGQGGLELGNMLGGLGGAPANQGAPAAGYGNQVAGGYEVQGAYQNPQLGQGGANRNQPGDGAGYMGH